MMRDRDILELRDEVRKSYIQLKEPFFLEQVDVPHSISTDYWLGRSDSEERTYLADNEADAKQKAEELINQM